MIGLSTLLLWLAFIVGAVMIALAVRLIVFWGAAP
jgi:hypothetical protein